MNGSFRAGGQGRSESVFKLSSQWSCHTQIKRNDIPGKGNYSCKGPKVRTAGLVGGMKSSVWPKSGRQGEIQGDEVGKVGGASPQRAVNLSVREARAGF